MGGGVVTSNPKLVTLNRGILRRVRMPMLNVEIKRRELRVHLSFVRNTGGGGGGN